MPRRKVLTALSNFRPSIKIPEKSFKIGIKIGEMKQKKFKCLSLS